MPYPFLHKLLFILPSLAAPFSPAKTFFGLGRPLRQGVRGRRLTGIGRIAVPLSSQPFQLAFQGFKLCLQYANFCHQLRIFCLQLRHLLSKAHITLLPLLAR